MKYLIEIVVFLLGAFITLSLICALLMWIIPKALNAALYLASEIVHVIYKFFSFLQESLLGLPIVFFIIACFFLKWDTDENIHKLIIGEVIITSFVLVYDVWLLHKKMPEIKRKIRNLKNKPKETGTSKQSPNSSTNTANSADSQEEHTYAYTNSNYGQEQQHINSGRSDFQGNKQYYESNNKRNDYSNAENTNDRKQQESVYIPKCFRVLGFTFIPTQEELKKRFRKLAKETHPDAVGGDGKRFILINEAYKEAMKYY